MLTFPQSHQDLKSHGETQAIWTNNDLSVASSDHVKMLSYLLPYTGFCLHHCQCHYKDLTICELGGKDILTVEKRPSYTAECWLVALICIPCPVLFASWLPQPCHTDSFCWLSADNSPCTASGERRTASEICHTKFWNGRADCGDCSRNIVLDFYPRAPALRQT